MTLEVLHRELIIAEVAGGMSRLAVEKGFYEKTSKIFYSKLERKENKTYTEDDLKKKIGPIEIENDFLRRVSSLICSLNPEKLK